MLVPGPVFVRMRMVVSMAVHRPVGMPMFVCMNTRRLAFDPYLTLSATTYRAHLSSPERFCLYCQW